MFTKSALLAFVTLATLATATLMQPRQAGGPIALPKQSSFTKSDGTFDYDKAVAQTVATKNKHRQTLINLQNNTGSLPQGFETKALASLPSSVEASLKSESGSFSIEYSDGSTVSGPVYEDTVAVAGIQVANQKFSPVTTLSASCASDPAGGIFGLAFPAISNLDADPFFVNANSQGAVDSNDFGFYLASSGSELYLGGISGASISSDGTTAVSDFEAISDSGTTIMYGPPSAVKEFNAQVSGSTMYNSTDGYYSFPCNSAPEVSFSWGGDSFTISADNFNLATTSSGASTCVGALAAKDLGLGDSTWLLGDSWVKNVYTVFSFSGTTVGFADLAPGMRIRLLDELMTFALIFSLCTFLRCRPASLKLPMCFRYMNFHDLLQTICPSSILPAEMKTEAPGRLSKLLSPVMSFMNHILRRPRYLDPSTLPAGRLNTPPVTTSSSPPFSSSWVASSRRENLSAGRPTIYCFPLLALKLSSVYQLHLTRLSIMYFYRLISALAFVSMVLAAAVPSPGSPTPIEVTFSGDSADSKWTKIAQNDAQVGVIKTLRDAWKQYPLQNVTSKDVKFHGFVTKAPVIHHAFGAGCDLFGGDCYLYKVKFSKPSLEHIGDCQGWVVVANRDEPRAEKFTVSGTIDSIAEIQKGISSMLSFQFDKEDFDEGKV
ncbi:aspartic peptidase domain-containing protein [Lentinula edodes]|uniref:Aspartic peptidase domain-containing protein n=1 Tax=Lentinula lateritia TaxID=40482 RepID=A0A9W9DHR6_9AGAR|nr:aspartic peptidase domain-containing protein [Lentinula edodes]